MNRRIHRQDHPGLLDEEDLWQRRDEPAVRRELTERFLPYAKSIAIRYRGEAESLDDLIQIASLGLVNAIDRYDPERGLPFLAFASPTIHGELKRHFRDRVSAIRVPRGIYERIGRLESVERDLSGELDRSASLTEVAAAMDCPVEQVLEAKEAVRTRHAIGLASAESEEEASLEDVLGSEDPGYERIEEKMLLTEALEALEQDDREIVILRYREELSQSQIAERIGCSQMHVSRKLRKIFDSLNEELVEEKSEKESRQLSHSV
ncbi:MAG: polymerase sigma-B factor [Actinomycetota bacterium]|jgi:RNA polymerase sigma-B factor|nr:polymerase sigma-B factor [Actinomycetota bacterium]